MTRPGEPMPDAWAVQYLKRLYDLEQAGDRTTLVVGPWTAFVMIAGLQLAARHPRMSDAQRDTLRDFTAQAMTWFEGTPGEALLRRGDDPAWDVPAGGGT